ncbi:DUF2157 domain-containing protein [Streptomonospora wellingtoniae]|uniref:DUF2157 domain-containing protein n=1 Tax=Streptomonospora wellingtoniae TaxID=3075544 RepID=A0ABU2KUP2_9ACTN|nr:DUF2157 domain-containing protein [Streptomonospora sp. DSM 45055]MDT0303016.1 DUF2157 domain-containing protein [Streptomonospora sp. DSM 45055]
MSESKPSRDRALSGLVERGVISVWQADQVRAALAAAEPAPGRVRWMEIAGYIGGGLVLAGAVALAAASWQELGDDARITLLAVLAAAAAAGAVLMTGGPQEMRGRRNRVSDVRRRIAGVLLALAAVLAAFAVAVAVGAVEDGSPAYVPPLVGLAVAAAGYAALPSAVGQVAVWGMSIGLVGAFVEEFASGDDTLLLGGGWLGLGVVWAVLSALGAAAERRLGLGLGAGLALAAAQTLLSWSDQNAWGYGATLLVAAACIAYYFLDRTAVLLVVGVTGVTVGVPEMVWDLTDGAIGTATVLLIAGVVLLAASWTGLLVHRRRNEAEGGSGPASGGAPGHGPVPADPPDAGPPPSARP